VAVSHHDDTPNKQVSRYTTPLDANLPAGRTYETASRGGSPMLPLACWLADYAKQVWLFVAAFDVEWTNNARARTRSRT
jgi:hypothetical protein